MNLRHFLRYLKCIYFLIVLTWMNPETQADKDFVHLRVIVSGRNACLCKLYWQYLCRSWWSSGMIPEKMSWVWFPARISTVYSKLPSVNALVFKFLVKHLHICSYKFSYRISDQEICSAMLYWFCNSNFFILLYWFGHSKKNPILGHISKVVNSGYKNYVICI